MAIVDDYSSLLDLLGLGANDWKERLQPSIKFTSPEGREFSAKWRGSSRRLDKKLGIFSSPKVKGAVVKDYGSESNIYPLTFYFDGKDNDKTARAFFYAIGHEDGQWQVIHPVHGFLGLVPINIEENDEPIESGNVTMIRMDWIEDIDPVTEQTAREMAGIVDELSLGTGLDALDQFLEAIDTASNTLEQTMALTAMAVENASERALSPLTAVSDLVYTAQMSTHRAIQSILNSAVMKPIELGAKIQDLFTQPALAKSDIDSRLDYYDDCQDKLFETLPGELQSPLQKYATAGQKKNSTAVAELALTAVTQARATIAITGPLKSRSHAVNVAKNISEGFNSINARLEEIQVDLQDQKVDKQYFAGMSFTARKLVGYTLKYLYKVMYDLKVERKITLEKMMTPIDLVVREYGQLGQNDEYLDMFYESNNIEGNEHIMMPAGKEVVVYI